MPTWWRHQMERFSALLALCAGTRSFDIFFDLSLNNRLSTQWRGWWFETPSSPLWRHCNEFQHLRSIFIITPISTDYCNRKNTATDVQCAYRRTTGSSSALGSSRSSESWVWLGAKDVTLTICVNYSKLGEFTLNLICSLMKQVMVSQKLIQCPK